MKSTTDTRAASKGEEKSTEAIDFPVELMGRGLSRFGTLQSLMRTECVYTLHTVSVSVQESTLFKVYFV